jgi:ppGpp synthetase/RelA/SpoT-type nucleotidyltranferase
MAILSKTQVDRLGERLKKGSPSEDDLRLLDQYRRSFGAAYDNVIKILRDVLHSEPTGRPAKSTGSIIEKLRRESIRLSQVQDIAGCRIVVTDILAQDEAVGLLLSGFPDTVRIMDRRINPSYGYRAVHVIMESSGKPVEIQVRTYLQHVWAELSEVLSDVVDSNIKYGGGDAESRNLLATMCELITRLEEVEKESAFLPNEVDSDEVNKVEALKEAVAFGKNMLAETLRHHIDNLEKKKDLKQ